MPKIFKRGHRLQTDDYVFRPTSELVVDVPKKEPPPAPEEKEAAAPRKAGPPPGASQEELELHYAQIQAEAILEDARHDAERYREELMRKAEEELDQIREDARQEGYSAGYADGLEQAKEKGEAEIREQAKAQADAVAAFMEQATRMRDQLLADTREEMKDLAAAIAEKVIRVSLKNSSDILLRMVDAATDTHKRCEWAHIYVADCDLHGKAYSAPELTAALGHISNRIRVVPMADDESGTCIVELPDVILDASVSTQMANIREVLSGASLDPET